jgi:hypothetical protein
MITEVSFEERRRALLLLEKRRSLEQTLVDLLATYEYNPFPELARAIELLRAEIALRKMANRG